MNNVIISNGVVIEDNRITLGGKILPPLPKRYSSVNLTTINDEIFINGYEWKNGYWKRTLRALWHWFF